MPQRPQKRERERATEEISIAAGAVPERINPVVDITLSSSISGGVILPPVSISSPTRPKMGPPATAGSSTQISAHNQPTTGTIPEIGEGTAPTSHRPKTKVVKTSTPKSPAKLPSSSVAEQLYQKAQEWIPISSEGDDQSPQANHQPQMSKMRTSKFRI